MSNAILKNGKEFDLWNKFFSTVHPGKEIEGICIYPIEHHPVSLKGIRFLVVGNDDVTYNFPANQYELLKANIVSGNWQWLATPNGIKELQHYSVGPRAEHRWGNSQFVYNPFLNRLTRQIYQLPRDVFFGDNQDIDMGELESGDFLRADASFTKVANLLKDVTKQINANLKLIAADPRIKNAHELIFSCAVDTTHYQAKPALDKVHPLLPEGGKLVLEQRPIVIEEWAAYPGLTTTSVTTIVGAVGRLNSAIAEFMAHGEKDPLLAVYVKDLMNAATIQITNAWQPVYNFKQEEGKELIDEVANKLLTELGELPGVPGMDLNSWQTYNYADLENPVKYEGVDYYQSIACKYTESFVRELYNYLMGTQSPLLRPYARIQKVAEENIGDHAIGSMRLAD